MFVTIFMTAALPAHAQVAPAATEPRTPLEIGGGFSYYDVDWAHTRMDGITLWADYRPARLPRLLRGFGIEAEARDINWNQGDKPSGFRLATGGGGLIYEWTHIHNFKGYFKGDAAFGGIDFGQQIAPGYSHDTRTVWAPGLGVEYRVMRHVWARVDYEYQFWADLTAKGKSLNPQGFTAGFMYDLRPRHGKE